MCCLFGLLDYGDTFSGKEKIAILSVLSRECEVRGVDATGIAYNVNGKLSIFKRPLPAHKVHFTVPNSTRFIMGHTRMTTKGSEQLNYNNHPFLGEIPSCKFALAHNGILYNDNQLRTSESLPQTKIQTDSFVAVQLIEKQNALSFGSLKNMAEKVEGSFTFTVLDSRDNFYAIRGDNPFTLYHYPQYGFFLYASTSEILTNALMKLGIQDWPHEHIILSCGDILRIDKRGKIKRGVFNTFDIYDSLEFLEHIAYHTKPSIVHNITDNDYVQELKSVASYCGYSPTDIDYLLSDGFSFNEIEDMLYMPSYEQYLNEEMDDLR